jgi:hypothetical protein
MDVESWGRAGRLALGGRGGRAEYGLSKDGVVYYPGAIRVFIPYRTYFSRQTEKNASSYFTNRTELCNLHHD